MCNRRLLSALVPVVLSFGIASYAEDQADIAAAFQKAKAAYAQRDLPTAVKRYEEALAISVRVLGEKNVDTAFLQNNLAFVYEDTARYADAEALYRRSLKTYEAQLGPDDLNVGRTLNNLAALLQRLARYAEAEPLFERSLKIREAKAGANHPDTAETMTNLAYLYQQMGRHSRAEPLFQQGLKIQEAALGPEHRGVGLALNNLAVHYRAAGRETEAEPLLLRSLKIHEAQPGPENLGTASVLLNLADVYAATGRDDRAVPLLQRCLTIREKILGKDHPEVAAVLNNLAAPAQRARDYRKAEEYLQRALRIFEAKAGANHPAVATALNNLARLYDRLGRSREAEPLYERVLQIRTARLGPEHPETAAALNNLGVLSTSLGRLDAAEDYHRRGLKTYETAFGGDHPEIARSCVNLAVVLLQKEQETEAVALFDRARRMTRRHVARTLPALSDKEQLKFLKQIDWGSLSGALSVALRRPEREDVVERTAVWSANAKGMTLEALAERVRSARDARDPQSAAELRDVRTELATLALSAPRRGQEGARRDRMAKLSERERTLTNAVSAERGAAKDDPWVDAADIRTALPPRSALIDIVRLERFKYERGRADAVGEIYAAWVLPAAGAGKARVFDLGPAEKIDLAIRNCQTAVTAAQSGKTIRELGEVDAEQVFAKPLQELATLVLKPLEDALQEVDELVISPDAGLWLIPWSALPTGEFPYAVERWKMRFVTAGREPVTEKQRPPGPKPGPARIIANPDYDQPPADALSAFNALIYPDGRPPAPAPSNSAEIMSLRSASTLGAVARLPSTGVEAELIAPKLKELTHVEPRLFVERNAQEGVLKMIRHPRILVVSTHGFFLPEQRAKTEGGHIGHGGDAAPVVAADDKPLENPLLRCGLLLAGCNQSEKYSDPGLGDGVLTGLEIVGCDFRGAELVVLSACETGLGDTRNGEGVAGLRQSFQLAGAAAVVSTLWQIPDRQSAILMNDFFTGLAEGRAKPDALRNAQLKMIKSRRDRYQSAHPIYWGAWTITGG